MTINLGSLSITMYSVMIILGILFGYIIVLRRKELYSIASDDIDNLLIVALPSAVIGARIYHILAEWKYYSENPEMLITFQFYGMGIFGAIIGAIFAIGIYCRIKKLPILDVLDLGSVGLLLGQVIGRFGNWFNKELYGFPTNLPWKIFIPLENRPSGYESYEFFHPTFLYEAFWNLAGVLVLLRLEKRIRSAKHDLKGLVFWLYLIWYGIGRFLIGFVRLEKDDLWVFNDGQIFSLLIIIVATFSIWMTWRKGGRR